MQPEKEHFSSIFILLKESEFVINVLGFFILKAPHDLTFSCHLYILFVQ